MRRARNPLPREIYRAAEPEPAAIEAEFAMPLASYGFDLLEHPFAAPFCIGSTRFAAYHFIVHKRRDRELGSADVNRKRRHREPWDCPRSAASTSSGEAVPVPFFMMVID